MLHLVVRLPDSSPGTIPASATACMTGSCAPASPAWPPPRQATEAWQPPPAPTPAPPTSSPGKPASPP